MSDMADIFVSYKAEDRPRVQSLVNALEAEGFSVWWDAHIGGGTDWRSDIEDHLNHARCVIVVWSKNSVGPSGKFVRDEATRAQELDTYLPVRLDGSKPPLGFGEIQALSLEGWRGKPADPRFRAVVEAARARLEGRPAPQGAAYRGPAITRRAAMVGTGVAAVAVAGGAGYWLLGGSRAEAKRIAVMPFANLSGSADQAYLSDGLSEELRASLSRVGLQVIGRASSDAVKDMGIEEAASKLGAANLLTGSVRATPNLIRINAQLVFGKDGVEKWSQSYDRKPGDIISIQTDIATQVAQALTVALASSIQKAVELGGTKDPEAQRLYLQAREVRTRLGNSAEAVRQMQALLDQALARDPNFANAWLRRGGIEGSYAFIIATNEADRDQSLGRAERYVQKGLKIAPGLAMGYAALANLNLSRFRFRAALAQADTAYQMAPSDPDILGAIIDTYVPLASRQRLLDYRDHFVAADPLNPLIDEQQAAIFFAIGDYTQAIKYGERAMKENPKSGNPKSRLAWSYLAANRNADAARVAAMLPDGDAFRLTYEGVVAARGGNRAEAERKIAAVRAQYGDLASYQYAQVYAQMGDKDTAFASLDAAMKVQDPGLSDSKIDPLLDPLRADPRFAALLKRLDFPDS